MMRYWLGLGLMLHSLLTGAAIDTYEFTDKQSRERYSQLTQELRCPKCQNQNLADSNSPISSDMRREVYRMISAGESDAHIRDFMVERYGEFVLYRPQVNPQTWALWFGPFVLLLIGALVIVLLVRRSRQERGANALSASEQARLQALLDKDTAP